MCSESFLLYQQSQNAFSFFYLCVPSMRMCLVFFLSHKHKASDFKCPFCTFSVSPEESHVDNVQCTEALPCACHLSNSCCCFSSLMLEGYLFIFVLVLRNSYSYPPISMKFHEIDLHFSLAGHSHQ